MSDAVDKIRKVTRNYGKQMELLGVIEGLIVGMLVGMLVGMHAC